MKVIFYIADCLTPLALKNPSKKNLFLHSKIKNNYINDLSKKSTFFSNCYGYGETFSVTSSMLTGKSPYQLYTDSFFLLNSFKAKNELSLYFKKKDFFNIYYSNLNTNANIKKNEYERYFKLVNKYFDVSLIKKKNNNYNFENFLKEFNLSEVNSNYKNIFYLFHENSLHDDPTVYKNCTPENYLKKVDELSKLFKKQMKLINFDEKTDIIYFLSDHGLLMKPYDQLYYNKNIKIEDYNKYFYKNLADEKLKFTFFIKNPVQKQKIFDDFTLPENILSYVKTNQENQSKKKIKNYSKKEVMVSCRSVEKSPYINLFNKFCFHNHFLLISKKKKISFNRKHPCEFWDLNKNLKIEKNKIDKKFLKKINNYYSIKNIFTKLVLFCLTILMKLIRKPI